MRGQRFLVIIAHPEHGRIARVRVSPFLLHVLVASLLAVAITAAGLAASYFYQSEEHARLLVENQVLRNEYEDLLGTSEERGRQVESLSDLAYQVSIAYGLQREVPETTFEPGSDAIPAFYASQNQYDLLQEALFEARSGVPRPSRLANSTPSIWPVRGRITSAYGRRQDPFNGERSFHPGIDISSPAGTPVVATADGNVISAEWEGGLGRCVKLLHGRDGYTTVYGHLTEYFVLKGQAVRRGEVIGLVGSSGRTTGQHVHYEVHYRKMAVNPYRFLKEPEGDYDRMFAD